MLFSTFGVAACSLPQSVSTLFGSYDVATRRFEMGLRISLGRHLANFSCLVIREALYSCDLGILAGLIVTYWGASSCSRSVPGGRAESLDICFVALVLIRDRHYGGMVTGAPCRRAPIRHP